jgi:uncharacterized membrane protein
MDLMQLLAIALHTVAFTIAWGYYGILGRIVLPALERSLDPAAATGTLAAIEGRALPLVLVSMILFILTGAYLLVINPQYTGLGDVSANTWSTLMLVKHGVVIVLVVLGVVIDRLVRRAALATDDARRSAALGRVRLGAEGATGLGAVIVLLTAAAQLST